MSIVGRLNARDRTVGQDGPAPDDTGPRLSAADDLDLAVGLENTTAGGSFSARVASWGSRLMGASVRTVASRIAPPYSRLYVLGDGANWALAEEAREVCGLARRLGIPATTVHSGSSAGIRRQKLFHTSQFILPALARSRPSTNRIAVAYYHGAPNAAYPEFAACLQALCEVHSRLWRVQVPCRMMRDLVRETGIAPDKVRLIPIGVNPTYFPPTTPGRRRAVRAELNLPEQAVVVGSFQKDGIGWGEGTTPKLIKGPDILLAVLSRLQLLVPGLHVLLSGAARGYVRRGLETLGIPYRHVRAAEYADVGRLYHAVDLTLVTSREEGGPKAMLESMCSGIPLVSTRVGQAADLVVHGQNGWLAEVDDVDGLVAGALQAIGSDADEREAVVRAGHATADEHSYRKQLPLWRAFFAD